MHERVRPTLNSWLDESLALQRQDGNSRHVDELSDCDVPPASGLAFLSSVLGILERASQHVNMKGAEAPWRSLLLVLPLGDSDALGVWNEKLWGELNLLAEPPSLYLLNTHSIFDEDAEFYQRPVSCPVTMPFRFSAGFRSFRSREHIERNWEFSNILFFIVHNAVMPD